MIDGSTDLTALAQNVWLHRSKDSVATNAEMAVDLRASFNT